MELVGSSTISGVVVHARGAIVSRTVMVDGAVPDGDLDLSVPGITPMAEPASVRAVLRDSKRSVISVRSSLVVPAEPARASVSAERLQDIENRLERVRAEVSRLERRRGRLTQLRPSPRWRRSRPENIDSRFADALAFSGLVAEVLETSDARLIELQLQLEKLTREFQQASLEHGQQSSQQKQGTGHPQRAVTVRLGGAGPLGGLEISYAIPGARWWPLYTLRLTEGGQRGSLALEALVAQRSGEDWSSVPVALSTADLLFDAQLPELASLHLGRAQQAKRPAYRPPPPGLDRLFEGYDRTFGASAPMTPPANPPSVARPKAIPPPTPPPVMQAFSEVALGAPHAGAARAVAVPAAASMPAPLAKKMSAGRPRAPGGAPRGGAFGSGGAMDENEATIPGTDGMQPDRDEPPAEPELEIEPSKGWLDFSGLRLAGPESAAARGRLAPGSDGAAHDRARSVSAIDALRPPGEVRDPRDSRGQFDYRYELRGRADLPSDGLTHRVLLATSDGTPQVRFRSVPRDDAQVFREAVLTNPFDTPLLAGPVEVYIEGSPLTTSSVDRVDRGGPLTVGMGAEERVRIARNVRAEEENAGLLGGSIAITHTVTLDLTSSLAGPADLELVDRIPVTDEKGVEVKLLSSSPEATPYKQEDRGQPVRGGLRWKLTVAPGEKKHIEFKYRVSLSAKDELVGGNRRD